MTAYYNENDPKAAAWLRELIKADCIAPGDVDERSIEDVRPDDLQGYTQHHFFAGIGVWSHALRLSGWPDSKEVWTGSCPCQPFSAAGKRGGITDERHLWPAWQYLIGQQEPEVVFGEQVASKDGLGWFDLVQTDLEGSGYAVGANDICAAGIGAPHLRQRLWFVAERMGNTRDAGLSIRERDPMEGTRRRQERRTTEQRSGSFGRLADAGSAASERRTRSVSGTQAAERGERIENGDLPVGYSDGSEDGGLADTDNQRLGEARATGTGKRISGRRSSERLADTAITRLEIGNGESSSPQRKQRPERLHPIIEGQPPASPTNGFWRDVDWLYCRDGKWRPVEPGTFPLVASTPRGVGFSGDISFPTAEARVMRLKGYGNAINAEVARLFIESYTETT